MAKHVQTSRDCHECGAPIWRLKTRTGKTIYVNVRPTQSRYSPPSSREELFVVGKHQPHFTTCGKG